MSLLAIGIIMAVIFFCCIGPQLILEESKVEDKARQGFKLSAGAYSWERVVEEE